MRAMTRVLSIRRIRVFVGVGFDDSLLTSGVLYGIVLWMESRVLVVEELLLLWCLGVDVRVWVLLVWRLEALHSDHVVRWRCVTGLFTFDDTDRYGDEDEDDTSRDADDDRKSVVVPKGRGFMWNGVKITRLVVVT